MEFTSGDLCSCEVISLVSPDGPVVLLRIVGEIDLRSIPILREALALAEQGEPRRLVVDVVGMRFCSARGISLLADAGAAAAGRGGSYCVRGLSASIGRLWSMLWPEPGIEAAADRAAAATV